MKEMFSKVASIIGVFLGFCSKLLGFGKEKNKSMIINIYVDFTNKRRFKMKTHYENLAAFLQEYAQLENVTTVTIQDVKTCRPIKQVNKYVEKVVKDEYNDEQRVVVPAYSSDEFESKISSMLSEYDAQATSPYVVVVVSTAGVSISLVFKDAAENTLTVKEDSKR